MKQENKKAPAKQVQYKNIYTVNLVKNKINTAAMGGGNPPQPAQAIHPPTQQDSILRLGTLYTTCPLSASGY